MVGRRRRRMGEAEPRPTAPGPPRPTRLPLHPPRLHPPRPHRRRPRPPPHRPPRLLRRRLPPRRPHPRRRRPLWTDQRPTPLRIRIRRPAAHQSRTARGSPAARRPPSPMATGPNVLPTLRRPSHHPTALRPTAPTAAARTARTAHNPRATAASPASVQSGTSGARGSNSASTPTTRGARRRCSHGREPRAATRHC